MAVFHGSQFQHCGNFSETRLRMLNLTMSLTGVVGSLVTMFIFGVLIGARAYKTILQRLFIYSVLATMVHEIAHMAQIELQFQYAGQEKVCAHLGFISNWTGWVIYAFNLDIILYLLLLVHQQWRGGNNMLHRSCMRSACCRRAMECICVSVTIFLPVSIVWVPYKEHLYGLNEAYCYIKAFDNNCTEIGVRDKLLYAYSLYEGVGLMAIVIAIGILIAYCSLTAVVQNVKRLLCQIMALLLAITLYIVILNIMLAIDILMEVSYPLSIFFAIAATLTDLLFLFGYLLAFYSSQIKRSIIPQRKRLPPYHFDDASSTTKDYGSMEHTKGSTIPSYTYFDVPYTGEFTSVPD